MPRKVQSPAATAAAAPARFRFARVRVVGARVLPAQDIAAAFAVLGGRAVSAADLKPVLDKVNALYAARGYPLGRAYVPAQRLENGTLVVRAVEGYVGALIVTADDPGLRARAYRIASRLVGRRPLTKAALERAILLIQDLPGVTMGSQFRNMNPRTGATDLVIAITHRTFTARLAMDNRADLYSLPLAPYLTVQANDLLGWGDRIALTALLSPRQKDEAFYALSLSRWIGDDGLTMAIDAAWAQIRDRRSVPGYAVLSQTSRLSTDLSYPALRAGDETLTLDAGLSFTRAGYSLEGRGLAHDAILALRLGAAYARSPSPDFGFSGGLSLTQGLAAPGAGPHTRAGARPTFTKLAGRGLVAWRPTRDFTVRLEAGGQYGPATLYASQEAAFGATAYGRGFGAAEIMGDSGFGVSLQPQYRIPFGPDTGKGWSLTPYAFADYAQVFNAAGGGEGALLSAGGGVRLGLSDLMTLTLEAAKPLNRIPLFHRDRAPRFYAGVELGLRQALALMGESP